MEKKYCKLCHKELTEQQIKRGKQYCGRSCALKVAYQNPEVRQRVSDNVKKSLSKPEVRKKLSESIKLALADKNVKEKFSSATKERWKNEEYRQKTISSMKAYHETEIAKQSKSKALKNRWRDSHDELCQRLKQSNTPEVQERRRLSIIKAFSDPEVRKRHAESIKQAYNLNKESIIAKIVASRKANGTSKESKEELEGFRLLLTIFPDAIHHYTSKVYPFDCDYYVPSKDLYIEGHYGWYHNGKPFTGNEQDLKDLAWLQEKAKTSTNYANKVYQWTDLDVRKRQVVEKNNLNYVEVYSLEELVTTFNIKELPWSQT